MGTWMQLQTALLNLAMNARDAMPDGGEIRIKTGRATLPGDQGVAEEGLEPGDYCVLRVTDTGCGIPPDTLTRIFDPFITTKGVGEGTGLGLSMVYGFVKQSGGDISVASEPDIGTNFEILLRPRRRPLRPS